MICPVCHNEVPEGQLYCPVCHNAVSPTRTMPPVRRTDRAAQPAQVQPQQLVQCPNCGRPLRPGEVCVCQRAPQQPDVNSGTMPPVQAPAPRRAALDLSGVKAFLGRSGLAHVNAADPMEEGASPVPDAVRPMGQEKPLALVELGTMRSRVLGIPVGKGKVRLQVTDRRVILRAAGDDLHRNTIIHQELPLESVGAVKLAAKNERHWGDLVPILLLAFLVSLIISGLSGIFGRSAGWVPGILFGVLSLAFGLLVPKLWIPRSAVALGAAQSVLASSLNYGHVSYGSVSPNWALLIPGLLFLAAALVLTAHAIIRPELTVSVVTKEGNEALLLRRGRTSGSSELVPDGNIFSAMAEVNAMIDDARRKRA